MSWTLSEECYQEHVTGSYRFVLDLQEPESLRQGLLGLD